MDDLDLGEHVPTGGRAASSGGCFHVSFRSGSRSGGACALAAYDYITREDEYDDLDRDPVIYTESAHMPAWAKDDPATYWDAADLYERANGRLYVSADFALPRDLTLDDQIELTRSFAQSLTDSERLPYTLAIHAGRDEDGREHNPHAHLMFSERRNDGIERSREDWFRGANRDEPQKAGAPKSRTFHGREWVEHARGHWADLTNATLERLGRVERVDHRSYERQGVDREPGEHYGPAAAHMKGRGADHDRLDQAVSVADDEQAIGELTREIARLEVARETIVRNELLPDEPEQGRRSETPSHPGDRPDDWSWGR